MQRRESEYEGLLFSTQYEIGAMGEEKRITMDRNVGDGAISPRSTSPVSDLEEPRSRSKNEEEEVALSEEMQALIFPKRLMAVLGEKRYEDAIKWSPNGTSFMIVNKDVFVATVMPKFSPRKSKFSSFLRKLNRWGFTRLLKGPSAGVYQHEFFIRDKPHLASQMYYHNKRAKEAMKSAGPNPATVPLPAGGDTTKPGLDASSLPSSYRGSVGDFHGLLPLNALGLSGGRTLPSWMDYNHGTFLNPSVALQGQGSILGMGMLSFQEQQQRLLMGSLARQQQQERLLSGEPTSGLVAGALPSPSRVFPRRDPSSLEQQVHNNAPDVVRDPAAMVASSLPTLREQQLLHNFPGAAGNLPVRTPLLQQMLQEAEHRLSASPGVTSLRPQGSLSGSSLNPRKLALAADASGDTMSLSQKAVETDDSNDEGIVEQK